MRKQYNKKNVYSIRKFAVGAASVALGATFALSNVEAVDAQVDTEPSAGQEASDKSVEPSNKAVAGKPEKTIDPAVGTGSLEDAIENAEAFLKQSGNVGYTITQAADGKYYSRFSLTDDAKNVPEVEEEPEAESKKEIDPAAGFESLEDAVENAEAFLKQSGNVGYTITQAADGKYYARFSLTDDAKNVPEVEEEPEAESKKEIDPIAGFESLEDAIKNAEAFLEESENIGYTITQAADGKYYARFSITDDAKVVPALKIEDSATTSQEKSDLSERLAALEAAVKELKEKAQDNLAIINHLNEQVAKLRADLKEANARIDALETKVSELEEKVAKECAKNGVSVDKVSTKEDPKAKQPKSDKVTKKSDKKEEKTSKSKQALPQTGAATAGVGLAAASIIAGLGLAVTNKRNDQ